MHSLSGHAEAQAPRKKEFFEEIAARIYSISSILRFKACGAAFEPL
jgi:hypothetical protein